MIGQGERPAVVDLDDLEGPVAPQQALVGGGDGRFAGGRDRAVEGGQLGGRCDCLGHG